MATLDQEPISATEVALYSQDLRASVAAQFAQEYGITEMGQRFWRTEYNHVTPYEVLFEQALDMAVRDHLIRIEAQRLGLDAVKNFDQLQQKYSAEQASRSAGSHVIYGPESLTLSQFNRTQMQYCIDDLKATLLTGELAPTAEQLQQVFDQLDEEIRRSDFSVAGYVFACTQPQQQALSELIKAGSLPLEAAQQLELPPPEAFLLESATVHREDVSGQALLHSMFEMQVESFFEYSGQWYFLTQKKGGEPLTYEQAPRYAESKYINDAFEALIEQRLREAKLVLEKDSLERFICELEQAA